MSYKNERRKIPIFPILKTVLKWLDQSNKTVKSFFKNDYTDLTTMSLKLMGCCQMVRKWFLEQNHQFIIIPVNSSHKNVFIVFSPVQLALSNVYSS